jgi:hypothetical protein
VVVEVANTVLGHAKFGQRELAQEMAMVLAEASELDHQARRLGFGSDAFDVHRHLHRWGRQVEQTEAARHR